MMDFKARRSTQDFLFERLNQGKCNLSAAAKELGHDLEDVNGLTFCLVSFTDYMVNRAEHNSFYASLVTQGQQNATLSTKQWMCVIKDLLKSNKSADYAI